MAEGLRQPPPRPAQAATCWNLALAGISRAKVWAGSTERRESRSPTSSLTCETGTKSGSFPHRPGLTPGVMLVREWNDRTYQVQVLEEGYLYDHKVWGSLSEIAREITGARWNGPNFFGLRQVKNEAA